MQSKWCKYKTTAVELRQRGMSVRKIEARLGIPRSTLSYWFRDVKLLPHLTRKLRQDWKLALVKAREKAVLWHNAQKALRLEQAQQDATAVLARINDRDTATVELALAVLYFGEGSKKNVETALGNSDPLVLNFFLAAIKRLYNLNVRSVRCELYLRADQNPRAAKYFWAKRLKLPLSCFKQVNIDMRTKGSKTYADYHGVCNIRCGNVAIKRKLLYLSEMFLSRVAKQYLGG